MLYNNFCYLSFDCEWHRFAGSSARTATIHPLNWCFRTIVMQLTFMSHHHFSSFRGFVSFLIFLFLSIFFLFFLFFLGFFFVFLVFRISEIPCHSSQSASTVLHHLRLPDPNWNTIKPRLEMTLPLVWTFNVLARYAARAFRIGLNGEIRKKKLSFQPFITYFRIWIRMADHFIIHSLPDGEPLLARSGPTKSFRWWRKNAAHKNI